MKISKLLLFVLFAALCTSSSFALSKGDSAKEFLLTANDGSTWEVRSSKVPLAAHVGHTITATGVVSHAKMHNMKEDVKEADKDSGMKKSDTEHGHMKITDVKMVSDSCK